MTSDAATFQLPLEAAEAYDAQFVPRLFAPWASLLVAAADPRPGHHVLDVACGTGVVARAAEERVGPTGTVMGVDVNPSMLAVARRLRPHLAWHQADAARMPFADGAFDRVLCQAALMFFPDPTAVLREMARVVRQDGVVAILVPDRVEAQPAYLELIEAAASVAGPPAEAMLGSYFSTGDLGRLAGWLGEAGLAVRRTRTEAIEMAFGSIDEFVRVEVGSTPLAAMLTPDDVERLLQAARRRLAAYVLADGAARVPISAHVIASTLA